MKVKELIEMLNGFNPELEVVIKKPSESRAKEDFAVVSKSDVNLIVGDRLNTPGKYDVYDCSPTSDANETAEYLVSLSGPTWLSKVKLG